LHIVNDKFLREDPEGLAIDLIRNGDVIVVMGHGNKQGISPSVHAWWTGSISAAEFRAALAYAANQYVEAKSEAACIRLPGSPSLSREPRQRALLGAGIPAVAHAW
jgi:hypothetical protein